MSNSQFKELPQHLAIIMDGNRRWARRNGFKIFKGHEKVAKEGIQELVDHCLELGIPYLTLWAFSTENWKRSKAEVEAVLNLMREMFSDGREALAGRDVRINTIGDLSRFPQDIQDSIVDWKQETKEAKGLTTTFALNYGGHDELVRATRQLVTDLNNKGGIDPQKITQERMSKYLDTADLPKPDLIVRPGGERRLSGFMSWQSAYAELYFTNTLMPDFGVEELNKALKDYEERDRRFGG